MTVKLGHERLAEAHDLAVALALGIKIGAALGTAHGETGERVFEGLLESEEFDDRRIHARVQTQTALVGTDGGIELYAVAAIHLYFTIVIYPRDAECDKSFGFDESLDDARLNDVWARFKHRLDRFENFFYRLDELRLAGIPFFDGGDDFCNIILAVFHF